EPPQSQKRPRGLSLFIASFSRACVSAGRPAGRRRQERTFIAASAGLLSIREPVVLLLRRVGAARGHRLDGRTSRQRAGCSRRQRGPAVRRRRRPLARRGAGRDDRRRRPRAGDHPHGRRHPARPHPGRRAVSANRRRMDTGSRQDRPAAMAAGIPRIAGLGAGRRHPGRGPLSARTGPARTRHSLAARVGSDAGRDRTDFDRHSRHPSGPADQRPSATIAPGRERGGTARRRRGVVAMAPRLGAPRERAGLRRHARNAILSMPTGRTKYCRPTPTGGEKWSEAQLAEDGRSSGNGNKNVRRLVIVESPTKARKLAGYLGSNYIVESSRGHIRDLPRNAADVPAKYKTEPWARLGVDVDHNFEPLYIISPEKKSTVAELKDLLKNVDELYLATDGDREGEAIAWHLLETLKPRIPVKRMVFHEITEPAIRAAAEDPRDLDNDLVDAQETRRILDRLYGYEVSPVLWKKVAPKLSAGRVQSVATRIIVQRERDRMAFRSASYWDVVAELDAGASAQPQMFTARLVNVDDRRVATGRDFDSLGQVKKAGDVLVLDEADARALVRGLEGAE